MALTMLQRLDHISEMYLKNISLTNFKKMGVITVVILVSRAK